MQIGVDHTMVSQLGLKHDTGSIEGNLECLKNDGMKGESGEVNKSLVGHIEDRESIVDVQVVERISWKAHLSWAASATLTCLAAACGIGQRSVGHPKMMVGRVTSLIARQHGTKDGEG